MGVEFVSLVSYPEQGAVVTGDTRWYLLGSSNWVKGGKALHLLGLLERAGNVSFCYLKPYGLKAFICLFVCFNT